MHGRGWKGSTALLAAALQRNSVGGLAAQAEGFSPRQRPGAWQSSQSGPADCQRGRARRAQSPAAGPSRGAKDAGSSAPQVTRSTVEFFQRTKLDGQLAHVSHAPARFTRFLTRTRRPSAGRRVPPLPASCRATFPSWVLGHQVEFGTDLLDQAFGFTHRQLLGRDLVAAVICAARSSASSAGRGPCRCHPPSAWSARVRPG